MKILESEFWRFRRVASLIRWKYSESECNKGIIKRVIYSAHGSAHCIYYISIFASASASTTNKDCTMYL